MHLAQRAGPEFDVGRRDRRCGREIARIGDATLPPGSSIGSWASRRWLIRSAVPTGDRVASISATSAPGTSPGKM